MPKTILITGATDGIGREAAKVLATQGHHLLVHGRSEAKLASLSEELGAVDGAGMVETLRADMASLSEVAQLGKSIAEATSQIDVLINNAGVFEAPTATAPDGQDLRYVVNTLAPALLTRLVLPRMVKDGRLVHLSSAAQASVDTKALAAGQPMATMAAYAQSKLALTMWSQALAEELGQNGQVSVAVNPGSLLATNMVREGFGVAGNDIGIGADILARAALSDEFANANGRYYDNDAKRFGPPHADTGDTAKVAAVVAAIEAGIAAYL